MWIHGDLIRGPQTLYPPTREQFDALVSFLLANPDEDVECPLPIHGTSSNRPRWHAYDALSKYHIFRDKYELKEPRVNPRHGRTITPVDWPEVRDQMFLVEQAQAQFRGEPIDEEKVAEATARMNEVTPTSPCWSTFRSE